MRVLIAEDNEDNREMLSRRLVRRGWSVIIAENGKQAVEMARAERPDLILMDIGMPLMSGLDATRTLRQDQDGASYRIIALTAHAMETTRQECMAVGCDGFATKPVDFPALLATIAAIVPEDLHRSAS
jgi:CheY-like chemotaxis protein